MLLNAGSICSLNQSLTSVGAVVQLHFFLDDLFPRSFGRPLFGGGS